MKPTILERRPVVSGTLAGHAPCDILRDPVKGVTTMAPKTRARIVPFFWYAKEAEEAARFYASIFPESSVDRVVAMMSESPSGPPGSVKVVDFTLLGQRFSAMTAGAHHEFNDAISMMVLCADQAEVDRYWDALLERGGRRGERRRRAPPSRGRTTRRHRWRGRAR